MGGDGGDGRVTADHADDTDRSKVRSDGLRGGKSHMRVAAREAVRGCVVLRGVSKSNYCSCWRRGSKLVSTSWFSRFDFGSNLRLGAFVDERTVFGRGRARQSFNDEVMP